MPKMKSHSGAKDRFRKTKRGRWTHKKAGLRHLMTGMSSKTGRHLRKASFLRPAETKILNRLLPYA
ncbi:MAG: 50S ribosomal protein L35 [Elusimicrobia bacterium]|nr:50S ribosomal protein L35 [Elusimicrobiota bacterium]